MPRTAELTGVVRPEVDDRALDREASRMERAFGRAAELKPNIDVHGVRRQLERAIPGASLASGLAGTLTGRRGGGGGGGAAAAGGSGAVSAVGGETIQAAQLEVLKDIEEEIEKLAATGLGGDETDIVESATEGAAQGGVWALVSKLLGGGGGGSGGGGLLAGLLGSTAGAAGIGGLLGLGGVNILNQLGITGKGGDLFDFGQDARQGLPFGQEIGDAANFLPGLSSFAAVMPAASGDFGGAADNFSKIWERRMDVLGNIGDEILPEGDPGVTGTRGAATSERFDGRPSQGPGFVDVLSSTTDDLLNQTPEWISMLASEVDRLEALQPPDRPDELPEDSSEFGEPGTGPLGPGNSGRNNSDTGAGPQGGTPPEVRIEAQPEIDIREEEIVRALEDLQESASEQAVRRVEEIIRGAGSNTGSGF